MTTDMTAIGVDQYVRPRDPVLYPHEIDQQITFLTDLLSGQEDDHPDDRAEHDLLIAFRREVERVTGRPFENATIVVAEQFADFFRDWACEAFEISPEVETYVDWGRFAANHRSDYRSMLFGDDEVLVK